MATILHPTSSLIGKPKIPGDKSISHRSLMFGALAEGKTEILNLLASEDVLSTWKCLEALGVQISRENGRVFVEGKGLRGLREPRQDLDCGNSGTTLRLLMGILSGSPFSSRLVGDVSLSSRPMKRVSTPLMQMGAKIELTQGGFAPLWIHGTQNLDSIHYSLLIASAQLKSALLLAGLFAQGETILDGKIQSRDHSERLLAHFGISLKSNPESISIQGGQALHANSVQVPGDLSSAAFWIAAATLLPGSSIEIDQVSLNPSRIGILNVLERMGARIQLEITQEWPEPMGRLHVTSASLRSTEIGPDEIPKLIDEIPLIAVLATFAEGVTTIRGAEELRVKETDRIEAVAQNLKAMGGHVETFPDGLSISGPQILKGGNINAFGDHRIAMAFSIAALRATGPTEIHGSECVGVSYPSFYDTLKSLILKHEI